MVVWNGIKKPSKPTNVGLPAIKVSAVTESCINKNRGEKIHTQSLGKITLGSGGLEKQFFVLLGTDVEGELAGERVILSHFRLHVRWLHIVTAARIHGVQL